VLARSLGSQESTTSDFLSMLMFQPDYLDRLMEIGEADAEAQMDQIRALVEGTTEESEAEAPAAAPSR
jgi:NTE family protein